MTLEQARKLIDRLMLSYPEITGIQMRVGNIEMARRRASAPNLQQIPRGR